MSYQTKNKPPVDRWISLVERSIHEPGSIEWLESNAGNLLRSALHNCGFWDSIDYIFPEPCQENNWLYDPDTKDFIGYFITKYKGLYGYWSHDYAYRSHFFYISLDSQKISYYNAGDVPQFVIDTFAASGKEIALWGKPLNKDHPLLQKAKAECEQLVPPLHKSIATKMWNNSTPETFIAKWEARKAKHGKVGKI